MPLLAFIRKDTDWRIDWQIRRLFALWAADLTSPNPETLLLWQYRGRAGRYPTPPHANVVDGVRYIAS